MYFILMITMLYHAKLGNETIVEDYVTSHRIKKITKLSISALTYMCMIITTVSLFYIVSKLIIEEMSSVTNSEQHSFSIPLSVDLNTGVNWGALH